MKTPGVKLLEEIQPMPITENGTSDLVRKILQKKKPDVKESSPMPLNVFNDIINERPVQKEASPPVIPAAIITKPPPVIEEEKKEEMLDYSSMTAAELRKTNAGRVFMKFKFVAVVLNLNIFKFVTVIFKFKILTVVLNF